MKIVYNSIFEDFTHNGDIITNLEAFIACALNNGEAIEFEVEEDEEERQSELRYQGACNAH